MQQQYLNRPLIFFSQKMTAQGMIMTTSTKFMGIKKPEKTPNDRMGMIGLNKLAKKAAAVVLEVIVIALTLRLKE